MFLLNVFLVSILGYLALSELFMGNSFYQIAFLLLCIALSNLEVLIKDSRIKSALYLGLGVFSLFYPLMANIALLLGYAHIKAVKNQNYKWNIQRMSKQSLHTLILGLLSCYALYHDLVIGNRVGETLFGSIKGWSISFQMLFLGVFCALYSHFEYEHNYNQKNVYKTLDEKESFKISMQERLRELNDKNKADLYNEILSERNRIAKEIHDNVGHRLSSAIFKIGAISTINEDEAVRELVEELEEDLHLSMNDIKRSIYDIYDDVGNLKSYLTKLTNEFRFCKVHLNMNIEDIKDAQLKPALIAMIKESLNNVAKHSNATSVNIKLTADEEQLKLLIVDNGRIYKKTEERILTDHLGLRGMKENAEHFGGRFRFVFKNGFRIYVSIPIKELEP